MQIETPGHEPNKNEEINPILAVFSKRAVEPITSFRRSVAEIIRSYRHSWDIFSELIQNSVDAINRKGEHDPRFEGSIKIKIDSASRTLSISDNGIGIPASKLAQILAPGESLKKMGKDYGYKGYGLTFVCFVSKHFTITSVHDGIKANLSIDSALTWMCNDELPFPKVEIDAPAKTDEPSGTYISVKLDSGSYADNMAAAAALDSIFEWASEPKPLEYVLRTRTAIGNVGKLFAIPPATNIVVEVNIDGQIYPIAYEFLLPTASAYALQDTTTTAEYALKWADGSISDDAKRFRVLTDTFAGAVGRGNWLTFNAMINVCGRIGMTKLANDFDVSSESGLRMGTGFFLSLGGMPTGINLSDGPGSAFEQRYFVIIDANLRVSDQLDSGRKGISGHYAGAILHEVNEHIKAPVLDSKGDRFPGNPTLRTFASMMLDPDDDSETDRDMLEKYRDHEKLPDLNLELALQKTPDDENEVIALFAELCGRGYLPGYRVAFLSQSTRYDAVFEFKAELNEDTVYTDTNPTSLGLGTSAQEAMHKGDARFTYEDKKGTKWFAVEFKTRVQDIILSKRFKQSIEDLHLLVAWEADEEKIRAVGGKFDKIRAISRPLYGVTHTLTYQGQKCFCIVLKDVIDVIVSHQAASTTKL